MKALEPFSRSWTGEGGAKRRMRAYFVSISEAMQAN